MAPPHQPYYWTGGGGVGWYSMLVRPEVSKPHEEFRSEGRGVGVGEGGEARFEVFKQV